MNPLVDIIETQLCARGPIAAEVWGSVYRQRLARWFVSHAYITWSKRNFVPEDPLRIVLFSSSYLDDECATLWDVGMSFGVAIENKECSQLLGTTLGETIDVFSRLSQPGRARS
jgi:hypothetical protein